MQFQKSNRSAYLNFLYSNYERIKGEIVLRSHPYFIALDPSSVCQLACPLCPTGAENQSRRDGTPLHLRDRAVMTVEMFDALIHELGEYLFYVLFYNWGEPLLNKNLPQMIKKAKAYDIYTEIHTNLSLPLTDVEIESILTSGVDEIAASIDGFSKESYSTYRRWGNFELVKSNIQKLAVARDRLGLKTNIIWNFLVFAFNEHEIEATRRYCEQIEIIFHRREAFIDKKSMPEWFPSYRKSELNYVEELGHLPGSQTSARPDRLKTCHWHYGISVVNADGSVSPCCAPWDQKDDFGKIGESTGFADIWNNAMYRKSRASFAGKAVDDIAFGNIETICEHCPYDESIQNQYVYLDKEVERRFWEIFKDRDPFLEGAFSRFNDAVAFTEYCEHTGLVPKKKANSA